MLEVDVFIFDAKLMNDLEPLRNQQSVNFNVVVTLDLKQIEFVLMMTYTLRLIQYILN
jgi:hypothetical protein